MGLMGGELAESTRFSLPERDPTPAAVHPRLRRDGSDWSGSLRSTWRNRETYVNMANLF